MKANKKITKKEIRAAIKAADPVAICEAYYRLNGKRIKNTWGPRLYDFLLEFAPSDRQLFKAHHACGMAKEEIMEIYKANLQK